tara:strand:- start:14 stop:715 length:702 start_codon:yes stop_codon:yes gene_type:complete
MHGKIKNPRFKGKRKTARHFSAGGMLVGPSHEEGGIEAIVDGNEPIEIEGGEFVINKQTVDAVGEDFLHKLNSTETEYHTDGYDEGQLPPPSQFKDGGKVNGRNKMARKVRSPQRRATPQKRTMSRGGTTRGRTITTRRLGTGGRVGGRRKMAHGGTSHCGHPGQPSCESIGYRSGMGGYRGGGRTRPVPKGRKMVGGGVTGGVNKACSMATGTIDCKNTQGCTWNYSTNMCH